MSDYAKIEVIATYSDQSDYSPADYREEYAAYEVTPDEYIAHKVEAAISGGTTVTISHLASVTGLLVKNLDDTNFVTVTYTNTGASANSIIVPAGGFVIVPDADPAETFKLVADTAACICKIFICGS